MDLLWMGIGQGSLPYTHSHPEPVSKRDIDRMLRIATNSADMRQPRRDVGTKFAASSRKEEKARCCVDANDRLRGSHAALGHAPHTAQRISERGKSVSK